MARAGDGCLDALPPDIASAPGGDAIRLIDVLWLRGAHVEAAFEVEHTTSIYSGIVRLLELALGVPASSLRGLYLVAPDAREGDVRAQLEREGVATHVICVEGTIQVKDRGDFFRSAKAALRPRGVFGICDSTMRRQPGVWRPLVRLVSSAWKVPRENLVTAHQISGQLEALGCAVTTEEIGDRVWAPYCRAKRKELREDIARRGLAQGLGFAMINQLLAAADRTGSIGYSIIVGKT